MVLALLLTSLIATPTEIPIEMVRNVPIAQLTANGKPGLNFIVDTGAGTTVLDKALFEELKLKSSGSVTARGEGGSAEAPRFSGLTLTGFGEAPIELPGIAIDLKAIGLALNRPLHGVLGYEFFKGRVVEIDYPAKRLRLHDSKVAAPDGAHVLDIAIDGGRPFVTTLVSAPGGQDMEAKLLIDSGASQALKFEAAFSERAALPTLEGPRSSSLGVGGARTMVPTQVGRIRSGTWELRDVPAVKVKHAAKSRPDESASDGLIGNGVLSRYRVIVDYDRNRFVLASPQP